MEVRKIDFQKIEVLRLNQGLAKEQFCRKAGIAYETYSRIIKGADRVRDDAIIRIAKCLEVPAGDLVFWVDE